MDNKSQSIEALQDIRNIMNRSTRVLSLSGWSGVFAGVVALVGGLLAGVQIEKLKTTESILLDQSVRYEGNNELLQGNVANILFIAITTLIVAVIGALYFTHRKSKSEGVQLWSSASRRLIEALSVPLAVGGILCILFLMRGDYMMIAPMSLIFYGLALVNTSKYTLSETKSLGYIIVMLGIISIHWPQYGLQFWMIGFGLMHIVYGIWMWYQYDRKSITTNQS